MGLAQNIRNAYDFRNRDELERCLRQVDAIERGAAVTTTDIGAAIRQREIASTAVIRACSRGCECSCTLHGPEGKPQPGCFFYSPVPDVAG